MINSRPALGSIRRRRLCPQCDLRFSTIEVIDDSDVDVALRFKRLAKSKLRALAQIIADLEAASNDIHDEKDPGGFSRSRKCYLTIIPPYAIVVEVPRRYAAP